jgi:hypothetical protein
MKIEIIETTAAIKEILVINEEVVKCEGTRLCYPEPYFEMIETCKLCGKCV